MENLFEYLISKKNKGLIRYGYLYLVMPIGTAQNICIDQNKKGEIHTYYGYCLYIFDEKGYKNFYEKCSITYKHGYEDELAVWKTTLTTDQIKKEILEIDKGSVYGVIEAIDKNKNFILVYNDLGR